MGWARGGHQRAKVCSGKCCLSTDPRTERCQGVVVVVRCSWGRGCLGEPFQAEGSAKGKIFGRTNHTVFGGNNPGLRVLSEESGFFPCAVESRKGHVGWTSLAGLSSEVPFDFVCVCVHVHVCVLVCEDKSSRTRHEGAHQLLF